MDSFRKTIFPSAQSIYFPFDPDSGRFRSSFYDERMTNGQANKHEIQSFIGAINNFSSNFNEFQRSPKSVTFLMIAGIISFVTGCILIFYGSYYFKILSIIGLIGVIAGFYLGFRAVRSYLQRSDQLNHQIRSQLWDYVDKNSHDFKDKNLNWKIPEDHFDWIELKVLPNDSVKNKSILSEKDTRATMNSFSRHEVSSFMDVKQSLSKPLLTNL